MRRIALAVLAAASLSVGVSQSAVAADMPVKAVVPVVAAGYNWSGVYVGVAAGVSWWDIDGEYAIFSGTFHRTEATRFSYAGMLGAQYQWGQWVLGLEGSYGGLAGGYARTNSISSSCLGGPAAVADRSCFSKVNSIWTIGGRLGYAVDRWLPFVTAGFASGKVQTNTTITSAPGVMTSQTSAEQSGWYLGIGADYMLARLGSTDVILGVEYQHIDLGRKLHVDTFGLTPPPTNNRNMDVTVDTIRARLALKFSGR